MTDTPQIEAILLMDGDGHRIVGKYYKSNGMSGDVQEAMERQLFSKINSVGSSGDHAEVVSMGGTTAVFCGGVGAHPVASFQSSNVMNIMGPPSNPGMPSHGGGSGDVRVIVLASSAENEMVLSHICEIIFEALSNLMGGATDRNMVVDNLELVLLLLDEACDGGIILETDASKLVSSVLLRDASAAEEPHQQPGVGAGGHGSAMGNIGTGEMTLSQAFRQAREQIMTNLAQG